MFKIKVKNQKVCKEAIFHEQNSPPFCITVRHHPASLMMPNNDIRDGLFYPHLTPMDLVVLGLAAL